MKKTVPAAVAAAMVAFCMIQAVFGERREDPAKADKVAVEMRYGAFQGLVGGKNSFFAVDMRRCFECERKEMLERCGSGDPFRCSFDGPDSVESFYNHWLAVQLSLLAERGWKLVAVQDGRFIFDTSDTYITLPGRWKRILGVSEANLTAPAAIPRTPWGFSVPGIYPLDISKPLPSEAALNTSSIGKKIIVPPTARAMRLYFPVAVNIETLRMTPDWLNLPEMRSFLYDVAYDLGSLNVVLITFPQKQEQERFWRWFPLRLSICCRENPGEEHWMAWEFLDWKGEPLASFPLPTRFFPAGFDKRFHPIPAK